MPFEFTGATEFKLAMDAVRNRVHEGTRAAVVEGGHAVERGAKVNASGRPGPNVITGTLRRGIRTTQAEPWGVHGWQVRVGPTNVYGRRVELGFLGRDAAGRRYLPPFNPARYPYFAPAWGSYVPRWEGVLRAHWARALEA